MKIMNNDSKSGGSGGSSRVIALIEQFRQIPAAGATSADRLRRNELLDEIQDVVGLSGKMVTERDIIQRAQSMLGGS
jgi:hypothetical protein